MCGERWEPESGDVTVYGYCPSCNAQAAVVERCEGCPVLEIEHQRARTQSGRLLERVLEHEFDCKHYVVDPSAVDVEVREGLKILEQERGKWEKETRERQEEEREEQRRLLEVQRRGGRV